MSSTIRVIYLYVFWFLFIYSSKTTYDWLTPIIAIVIIFADKHFFYPEISNKKVTIFSLITFVLGYLLDNLLVLMNLMNFGESKFSPPYMWSIWLIFVPYFQFAFNRFYNKLWIAMLIAGVCAPFSYRGGTEIADLKISGYIGLVAIGIGWAIVFPLMIFIHKKMFTNTTEQSLPQ